MTPEVEMATGVETGTTYPAAGPSAGTVAFFSGCVMNSLLGNVNRATVELLNAAGYDVVVPDGQICCGALANHAGLRETATAMARRNLETFSGEFEAIIVNASGCSAMLAEYPLLLDGAEEFSSRIEDIASFLARAGVRRRRSAPRGSGGRPLRVGYDDPCHLLHAQKIAAAPRLLLGQVPGLRLVPLAEADWCCGGAGSYSLLHPETSARILARKMGHLRASGAEVVATGNPGCLLQLRLGARDAGLPLRVVHPVELLAEAYE